MSLDSSQILKKCFDSTKNALRIAGVAGSLDGQITWNSGLGAIVHILGPTDESLSLEAQNSKSLTLGVDGTWVVFVDATAANITSSNAQNYNLNAIAGGAAVTLTVSVDGGAAETITFASTDPLIANFAAVTAAEAVAVIEDQAVDFHASVNVNKVKIYHSVEGVGSYLQVTGGTANNAVNGFNFATASAVYGTSPVTLIGSLTVGDDINAGEDLVFMNATAHSVTGASNQTLTVESSGTGHLILKSAGGSIEIEDSGAIDLSGSVYWAAGLGALTHLTGPSDQNFLVVAQANRNISLSTSGTGHAIFQAVGGSLEITDNAGIDLVATANQGLDLSTSGSGHAVLQAAGGSVTITDDAGIDVTSTANHALDLNTSGTGHVIISAVGGTITVNDDGAGITVVAAANGAATLSTSGTGHATVQASNSSLLIEDGATGAITLNCSTGTLTLTAGLIAMTSGAQTVKTLSNELGTAHTYAIVATDYIVGIDCSSDAKAVTLPAAATAGTGRVLIIKDQKGGAGAKNITINPTGGEHIDLAHSYVLNSNFQSVTLVCTGVAGNEWMVV